MPKPILILGSGLAGYSIAREIRKLDSGIPVTLISADAGGYYSKPTLSNALASARSAQSLIISSAERMAQQLNISVVPKTEIEQIDTQAQRVFWRDGEADYGSLVMAVGSDAVRIPWGGDALHEILHINDIDAYADFRKKLSGAQRIVIIGAGLVGCEFADDIRSIGVNVDVVEAAAYPLSRFCPEEGGSVLRVALASNGVRWHCGRRVSSIDKNGMKFCVTLDNKEILECDLVLSAVGLLPRIDLAASAGISINKGIQTDRYLETSVKNIYALGDCSEVEGNFLPFVMPIMFGARALASTLVTETPVAVDYPLMPIIVKTPSCPVSILPPPRDMEGRWELSGTGNDSVALFRDSTNIVRGFALFGSCAKDRSKFVQKVGWA